MRSEKNILIAFILNIGFSVFEFFGGIITGSISIISDSIHDLGDALSIGISYFLEKKSKKKPDNIYTYGYARYSVLGAIITTFILIIGSVLVIFNAIKRIINPVEINYNGMLVFAIIGVIVNFLAAYFTKEGASINQKSVNLHMLEDVFNWVVVLIGAILIKFTSLDIIDPILSILVAIFILFNSIKNLKEIIDLFLEKIPKNISLEKIKDVIKSFDGVIDVHHIHIWSIDGVNNYATMHVVTKNKNSDIKNKIREKLIHEDITHVTIELETEKDKCENDECNMKSNHTHHHHHH